MATDYRESAVGTNIESWVPRYNGPARSIRIDNRSGSYLYIPNLSENVPPYTLGWIRAFPWDAISVSIKFVAPPTGGLTVLTGDPIRVLLSDQRWQPSEGIQYATQREPERRVEIIVVAPSGPNGLGGWVGAVARDPQAFGHLNTHFRLFSVGASLGGVGALARPPCGIVVTVQGETVLGQVADIKKLRLGPNKPSDFAEIPPLDLAKNGMVSVSAETIDYLGSPGGINTSLTVAYI
jgi:hypothetical protein